MKIRNGFVSNSSSSSFIVSAEKGVEPTVVIKAKLPYDEKITTIGKLNAYYINYYSDGTKKKNVAEALEEIWVDWPEIRCGYDNCVKEIKAGRVLFFGSVANECDDEISVLLFENGLEGNVVDCKLIV